MASLTEVSTISRKVIRYGTYIVILLIVGRLAFIGAKALYGRLFPEPPPKPTVVFGKLPALPFPEKHVPSNLSYSLETPDAKLPVFPEQIEVYFMPPSSSLLGGLDEAKRRASSMGFNRNGKILLESVPNVYIFEKDNAPSHLTMNIVTGIFSISYDVSSDPSVIGKLPPAAEVAISSARSFYSRAGVLEDDLKERASHEFLRIESGQFIPAVSLSEADLTKVNLFRGNYSEDIPAATQEYSEANVWMLLSGAGRGKGVVASEYHYYPVDKEQVGTYPLITAEQAWEDLKSGKAYIPSDGGAANGANITIRKVYLAYYDAGQYTEFYQPVVIFEGDNDFAAYVPAISPEFYGAEAGSSEQ
jgi:hypothetical protein